MKLFIKSIILIAIFCSTVFCAEPQEPTYSENYKPKFKSLTHAHWQDIDWNKKYASTVWDNYKICINSKELSTLQEKSYPIKHIILEKNVAPHLHKLQYFSGLSSLSLKGSLFTYSVDTKDERVYGIQQISQIQSLHYLSLSQTNIFVDGIFGDNNDVLKCLSNLGNLKELDLSQACFTYKNLDTLVEITENMKELQYLNLKGYNTLTKAESNLVVETINNKRIANKLTPIIIKL